MDQKFSAWKTCFYYESNTTFVWNVSSEFKHKDSINESVCPHHPCLCPPPPSYLVARVVLKCPLPAHSSDFWETHDFKATLWPQMPFPHPRIVIILNHNLRLFLKSLALNSGALMLPPIWSQDFSHSDFALPLISGYVLIYLGALTSTWMLTSTLPQSYLLKSY